MPPTQCTQWRWNNASRGRLAREASLHIAPAEVENDRRRLHCFRACSSVIRAAAACCARSVVPHNRKRARPGRKFRLAYTNSYVSYNRWITDSIARHRCGQGPPRSPWPCFSPHFARVLAGLPCTSLACAASLRCQVPCVFPLMHVAHRVIPRRLARCCSEHACCTEVLLPPLRHRRRTIPPRCRHTRCSSTILPIDPMT